MRAPPPYPHYPHTWFATFAPRNICLPRYLPPVTHCYICHYPLPILLLGLPLHLLPALPPHPTLPLHHLTTTFFRPSGQRAAIVGLDIFAAPAAATHTGASSGAHAHPRERRTGHTTLRHCRTFLRACRTTRLQTWAGYTGHCWDGTGLQHPTTLSPHFCALHCTTWQRHSLLPHAALPLLCVEQTWVLLSWIFSHTDAGSGTCMVRKRHLSAIRQHHFQHGIHH